MLERDKAYYSLLETKLRETQKKANELSDYLQKHTSEESYIAILRQKNELLQQCEVLKFKMTNLRLEKPILGDELPQFIDNKLNKKN